MAFDSSNLANLTAKQGLAKCLTIVPLHPIKKIQTTPVQHTGDTNKE
jgi:hypothetical protein